MLNIVRSESRWGARLKGVLAAFLLAGSGAAMAADVPVSLCAKAGVPSTGTGTPNRLSGVNTVYGYAADCASAVTLPGGPVIYANVGDRVIVTLTNNLPQATGLLFQGQAMVPDTTGVASGATNAAAPYTFTVTEPGTFLYEAAPIAGAEYQVAMGLYGALVVRPATAGYAYGNASSADPAAVAAATASAYTDEKVLVLSEIDPALNNSTAPATFDMRNYAPKFFLINGKPYPATDPILSAAGRNLLLRYVNAGVKHHSMSVLGLRQRFVAKDGSPLPQLNHDVAAETLASGQTGDAIVALPVDATGRFAVYDANLALHNNGAAGIGGMLTFVSVGAGTAPVTSAVALAPNRSNGSDSVALTASIASATSTVSAAEYFIDAAGTRGTGVAMLATDGAFDGATEAATATINLGLLSLPAGNHTLYVHGQDAANVWGAFSSAVLTIDNTGPGTSGLVLSPNPSYGAASGPVILSATGDDTLTGGSNITAAEYTVDGGAASPMSLGGAATPVRSLVATIPAGLVAGAHTVAVRSQDALGNWGPSTTITLNVVADTVGPLTSGLTLTPNPSDGTVSVALAGVGNDTATGGANIAAAEYFLGAVGANGAGAPMTLAGTTAGPVRNLSATIPAPVTGGIVSVHSLDASGNWGPFTTITLVTLPVTTGVSASPNPNNGARPLSATQPVVRVSATVSGSGSTIGAAEGFLCTTPALNCTVGATGSGFAFVPSDGAWGGASESVYADIPLATINALSAGDHTIYVRGRNAAGNWGATSSTVLVIDKTAPTVSIARVGTDPTNATSVQFLLSFSESVSGGTASNFTLATTGSVTGAAIASVTGTGNSRTVTVNTGTGSGTVGLNMTSSTGVTDLAGNAVAPLPATGPVFTIDKTPPTVSSINRVGVNPTSATNVDYLVTFSESVTGDTIGNFSLTTTGVTGASITGITGSGTTRTVSVNTGLGSGTIRLDKTSSVGIVDAVGNAMTAGNFITGQTYTVDKTVPTVASINRAQATPTNAATRNFTVTFSESVTGVTAANFSLTTTGVTGASITGITGSGTTRTVSVNTGSGSGTIRLDKTSNAGIADVAGNAMTAGDFTTGQTYSIDKTAPVLNSITRVGASPTSATIVQFLVTFSESVTGVTAARFSLATTGVTGASITGITGSGATRTVTVNTGTGSGTIGLNKTTNGAIADTVGNAMTAGNFTGEVYTITKP